MERAIGLEQLTMHAGLGVYHGVFDLPHAM